MTCTDPEFYSGGVGPKDNCLPGWVWGLFSVILLCECNHLIFQGGGKSGPPLSPLDPCMNWCASTYNTTGYVCIGRTDSLWKRTRSNHRTSKPVFKQIKKKIKLRELLLFHFLFITDHQYLHTYNINSTNIGRWNRRIDKIC